MVNFIVFFHVFLIAISNILVQYPFMVFGVHTTWGAFTYPLIFIITDLTVRLLGRDIARSIIFKAMIPGLIISYLLNSSFLALRIAFACFTAYTVGQLLDITVFQYFRNNNKWWVAPLASLTVGNILDTFIFFFLAFYHCTDHTLSSHWPEIAMVDTAFKLLISTVCFLPVYGVVLSNLQRRAKSYC